MLRRLALVLALASCGGEPASAPNCPMGTAPDAERTARLVTALGETEEGRPLAARAGDLRAVCFGEGPLSVVTSEHVALLDRHLGDAEAAARLGHLLVHERDGHPMAEEVHPDTDCAAYVHDALALEARAYAAESRLRAALGVVNPVMPFEIEAETAPLPDEAATARWLAYLEAHPEGAPGIDRLGSAYLEQCERERAAAR